jgi:3-oxoacyl-[acyl-carrier protein] reductase
VPKTPDYFKGKTLVVTGGASGIGRATAMVFGREGANVLCADINEQAARLAARAVTETGGLGEAAYVDVTKRESVRAMMEAAIRRFGRIDFLFNSAGSAIRRAKFLEIDDELWDKTYALNVKGTFYGMQEVIPHMLKNGAGVIVNVASTAARSGGAGLSPHYASSKGAVNTLTLGAAREFAGQGIRIISVSPTIVDTPFQDINAAGAFERAVANIPLKRAGRADEIGELVLFLCSDACEMMVAETVYVTGGRQ